LAGQRRQQSAQVERVHENHHHLQLQKTAEPSIMVLIGNTEITRQDYKKKPIERKGQGRAYEPQVKI
jgi:hypothetical protein